MNFKFKGTLLFPTDVPGSTTESLSLLPTLYTWASLLVALHLFKYLLDTLPTIHSICSILMMGKLIIICFKTSEVKAISFKFLLYFPELLFWWIYKVITSHLLCYFPLFCAYFNQFSNSAIKNNLLVDQCFSESMN